MKPAGNTPQDTSTQPGQGRGLLQTVRTKFAGLLPRNVRGTLILLILIAIVPREAVDLGSYFGLFQERRDSEYQINLELARSVADTFDAYVRDILRQELAVGLALTSSFPPGERETLLRTSAHEYPAIRDYGWANPQGQIIASNNPSIVGQSITDRPFFQEIVGGREWVVSELMQGRLTGEAIFLIARGIRDERGNLQGVVTAAVDPANLNEAIMVKRAGDAAIVIIDRLGRGVYRYPELQMTWEERNWVQANPIIGRALAGEEATGSIVSTVGLDTRLASYTPIESFGWVASASRSEKEVMAPLYEELTRESGQGIIVAIFASLVALFVSNVVTNPIRRLRENTVALEKGDLGRQVELSGPSELVDLARAFNRMSSAAEKRTRELELVLEAVRTVSMTEDLDTALLDLAHQLASTVDVPVCRLALLTNSDKEVVVRASYSASQQKSSNTIGQTYKLDDVPPARQIVESKQIVEIAGPESELLAESERQRWLAAGIRVALGVPLLTKDRVIGIITLGDTRHRLFTEDEKRLCLAVAQQASAAIEKADLHRQMAEEREQLNAIIQNASDGIFLMDENRRLLSMNPAAEALSGWTLDEVKGRPCWEILQSRDPNGISLCESACPLLQTMAAGHAIPYVEANISTKEGQSRALSVSYVYINVPSRLTGYGVVVARDITRLKEIEKLKDEFVSLLSHDLRNPLAIVQGQAQLLQRSLRQHEEKGGKFNAELNGVEGILAGARRMNIMIQDLVDSARLESGQVKFDKRMLGVAYFVYDLIEVAAGSLDVTRIKVDIAAELPPVMADPNHLERVLMNLLTNALKYSPSGSEVLVNAESSGDQVVVSVSDVGRGIPAEDLPHIFQRYFRATGSNGADGLGLGLYIARMLIEGQNGRIWAESELGKGSTFRVSLPVAQRKRES